MSDREVERLRKTIRQVRSGQSGTRTRYSAILRREVLRYTRRRRESGMSIRGIASELGLRAQLLQYWVEKSVPGRFRAVRIAAPRPVPAATGVVLVTAAGTRVEGLDVASVARLLRELS
ncbi:MAG: hypothetical protein ACE5H7_16195 [Acidiferrobacterales bacterium]